jgi:hypothetical protein
MQAGGFGFTTGAGGQRTQHYTGPCRRWFYSFLGRGGCIPSPTMQKCFLGVVDAELPVRNCAQEEKRIFLLPVMWFTFNLREKNKSDIYLHYITKVLDFFFYIAPLNMSLLDLLGVWLVLT